MSGVRGPLSARGTFGGLPGGGGSGGSLILNPSDTNVPAGGELSFRKDGTLAIGDNTTQANALPYINEMHQTSGLVDSYFSQAFPAPSGDCPVITISASNPIPASVDYAFNTTNVTKIGCYPVTVNTSYIQNQVNSISGLRASPWSVETMSTSDDHAIKILPQVTNPRIWIWVDGRPVGRTARRLTGLTVGTPAWVRFKFPTAKPRRIRVELCQTDFGGISVATSQSLTASIPVEPLKCVILGDSWVDIDSDAVWPNNYAWIMGRALGFQTYMAGLSGTGYIRPFDQTPYGSTTRLTPIYAIAPEYLIVSGTINDNSFLASDIQIAASALYAAIATNLPTTKIIVIGPQPFGTVGANRTAIASAAAGASNVIGFVDPISYHWFNGTGSINNPTGVGNGDYYLGQSLAHPSNAGAWYYARRCVEEIVRILDRNHLIAP